MGLQAPKKEKIKLFNNVDVRGNYVGVLRPIETEESEIEIPESAEREKSMENATARLARVGPEVEGLSPGDEVLVSIYMQRPHQVVKREDDDGEWHMFIIDSDMVVGVVHDQKESVKNVLDGGAI